MHWHSILLFACLTFSSFNILITCSPTNSFTLSGAPRYETSKQDRLPKPDEEVPTSLHTTFQPLRRRSLVDDLGEGWEMFLTHIEDFQPLQEAAADLRNFYMSTMSEAQDYMMNNHEEYNRFAFRNGNLAMTWQCESFGIPWILVHTVTSQLLLATYRGFATQFHMRFRHTHGTIIDVGLQVLPVAVQAFYGSTGSNYK